MPPRGGRGMTEEQKAANFNNHLETEEHKICTQLYKIRKNEASGHELNRLTNAWDDITDDWQPVLDKIFKLTELFKVPGRKAKSKLQKYYLMQNLTVHYLLCSFRSGDVQDNDFQTCT